jgi:hypothetical protein
VLAVAALVCALALARPGQAAEFPCVSGDIACLIRAINTANATGEENTITLEAGTYTLTAVDNTTEGPNGLPSVTSPLTIQGAGAESTVIERAASAPPFRLGYVAPAGSLTLTGLTLRGGNAGLGSGGGGGILNRGTLTVTHSILDNNVISAGQTSSGGGGLHNNGGTVVITNSTLANNAAVGGIGGGSLSTVGGAVVITDSTLAGNRGDSGGAIRNVNGTLAITNTTLANNVGVGAVGGGGIENSGTLAITNSTLAGNVGGNGGGLRNSGGIVTLQNTILARNAVRAFGRGPDCSGPVTSLGHNLLGDPTDCTIDLQASDLTEDPELGEFTDNGRPGRGYFPLLPDSPAIEAGDDAVCPETDQLGQPRVSPCDIGAVEFQTLLPEVLTVVIDIKPGRPSNRVNPASLRALPVAILTTTTAQGEPLDFDATTVDPSTVRFGATGTEAMPVNAKLADVDGDGDLDLLLHFPIPETGLQCGDTAAVLTGMTISGQAIRGADTLQTVRCDR